MSNPTILLPNGSPLSESSSPPVALRRKRVPPPPLSSHPSHPHTTFSWDDLPQENIIRTPSVQRFYPPPQHSVDWNRVESEPSHSRSLVARQHHTHHGQNIIVDYLTAYHPPVWVRYTVVYEQGEPSPFGAH